MKKMIFVRHGKAEDSESAKNDFQRSLTPKGREISSQMAVRLTKREKSNMIIVTSPAFRALETALIFAAEMKISYDEIRLRETVYGSFSPENLYLLLKEIDDTEQAVIFFGHNPSFTLLVNHFSGNNRRFMPKCGVACIEFETDIWAAIPKADSKLSYFLNPDGTDE